MCGGRGKVAWKQRLLCVQLSKACRACGQAQEHAFALLKATAGEATADGIINKFDSSIAVTQTVCDSSAVYGAHGVPPSRAQLGDAPPQAFNGSGRRVGNVDGVCGCE